MNRTASNPAENGGSDVLRKLLKILYITLMAASLPAAVWCCGVFYFLMFSRSIPWSSAAALLLAALWIGGCFFRRMTILLAAAEIGITLYFFSITPQERFSSAVWQRPWTHRPSAVILKNGSIQFKKIRDFRYRTADDFSIRYRTMTVDPAELRSLDLALSHWDGMEAVAHTMLAFNFTRNRTLVLSMETRLPEGISQNAVAGLFKQYEIIPVLGTPEDLFDLRIKFRGEDFYRYRTNATEKQARQILTAVTSYLSREPEFYNTLTCNCSTSLAFLLDSIGKDPVNDIRLLINGFSDRMLYDLGYLAHRRGESFASLKNRSYIPGKSRGTDDKKHL